MTKKELNEQKHMLKVLTENKAHTERLTDQTCNKIFGLPKATVLSNMDGNRPSASIGWCNARRWIFCCDCSNELCEIKPHSLNRIQSAKMRGLHCSLSFQR